MPDWTNRYPHTELLVIYYPEQMVQDRLELRAAQLHEAAKNLPHGDERESLLHRARRMQSAALVIDTWASSPRYRVA